jgi:hypothetical protein
VSSDCHSAMAHESLAGARGRALLEVETHRFNVASAFLIAIKYKLSNVLPELWVILDQAHQRLARDIHQLCRSVRRRDKSIGSPRTPGGTLE